MCHTMRCPTPDATMRKEPGPEGLSGPARHRAKQLGDDDGNISTICLRNDHCSERLHPPELIHHLACEDKPRLAQPGREEQDPALEHGKTPLVALAICSDLGGAPTQHKTRDWSVPLHALLFSLHMSPVKPFQDRHWAVKTGPIKSWIFSLQHFGRQHLPCCQGYYLSA